MVERDLELTNRGNKLLVLEFEWEDDDLTFSLVGVEKQPLTIDPGLKETLKLRFAPQDTALAQNTLLLTSEALAAPVKIRLRGNASRRRPEGEDGFWRNGEYQNELQLHDLVISASGIDFGKAGPNIISSISERIRAIQPVIQPYLGRDFDLASFVARQGRDLIDERLLGGTTEVLGGVFSGITFLVIVPFVAFFFLKEGNRMRHGLIELVPNAYFELCLNLLHQINGQIGGYIRGQILATSVVATLAVSGLLLIGMDYAVPLGLLAGLANMIPFLGPLIGIVSASVVALAIGGGIGLVGKVVILFLIIQIVDNVLIQPTVVARSVEMHPLVVLFIVMVGSQLMGIVGMLVAVPLTGIIKVSTQTLYQGIRSYRVQ
jgi:predicted PurR-regulated permease PerM